MAGNWRLLVGVWAGNSCWQLYELVTFLFRSMIFMVFFGNYYIILLFSYLSRLLEWLHCGLGFCSFRLIFERLPFEDFTTIGGSSADDLNRVLISPRIYRKRSQSLTLKNHLSSFPLTHCITHPPTHYAFTLFTRT